ncbi:NADPH:quinone reductase-like Zn-dependent oxidoreductase [Humibacillus xanthopallidus]|uniref:NADPH:quinone reductase-like Zn-dependent oxidoreductase n=1 Tax=Humibacillus xanthopallidus TaxID=412689 RepID=A0A543PWP5_9MICO|nr:NADP-dependent oxidoreductase [Humibacillus xanthopallidus]TQN48508.1 NADPH:quinone reductase-like Zn-dependent oxidoreductase [Humibacillus xanthopallidus]
MRAVRFHQYGGPEVLTLEDASEPHAAPGQVRIRVAASSVNPVDWKIREGYLHEMMPLTFPAIPGTDAAGVVDEVGEGVIDVTVGDAVFGLAQGGAAESAVLTAWARVPSVWTMEQAAAAGLASSTAIAGLDALGDASGKTILIEGASGGVGSAAVEIATARGASVIGTASEVNHEFLRSLGATPVTYGPGLADRVAAVAPGGVDAALDLAGSGSLAELVAIVGDPSKVASAADFSAPALGVTMVAGNADAAASLTAAAELGAAGSYTPRIQATYPLEQLAEAQSHVQNGHTQGKVVITV